MTDDVINLNYVFTGKTLFIADLHIKLNRFKEFELNRLKLLKETLLKTGIETLLIGGDFFDSANPTLEELKAGADFVDGFRIVELFSGNHEEVDKTTTLYDYLYFLPFSVNKVAKIERENYDVLFLDHHNSRLAEQKPEDNGKKHYLLGHYRSDIGFASSEVDNDIVSANFDRVILGDIHYRLFPKPNIEYVSSPYNISFSRKAENGYMILDFGEKDFKAEWIKLDLPNLLILDLNKEQLLELDKYIDPRHLYQVYIAAEPNIEDKKLMSKYNNIVKFSFTKESKVIKELEEKVLDKTVDNNSVEDTILKVYSDNQSSKEYREIARKILDTI